MNNILEWIKNPNREYQEGVLIYDKHKLNTKHDAFFATSQPDSIHKNMLLSKVTRIYQKLKANPNVEAEAAPEPIKIRKIEPVTKTEQKAADPLAIRKNKPIVNKLLVMNWSDLSFDEKKVFYNNQKYFLVKKSLMLENGDIEKNMRSLHAKVKTLPETTANDQKRSDIMLKLTTLDDKKAANWLLIDTWNEPEGIISETGTNTEKAVKDALEREKRIKANKIYIYRAEKSLDGMPIKTAKERQRIENKKEEIKRRKQELIEFGEPYKAKK